MKIIRIPKKTSAGIIAILLILTSLTSIILFTMPVRSGEPDTDHDAEPDYYDDDDDNDGYSDSDEVACGSNPLDKSSVPNDFDGDFIPDCVDPDDDNDDVTDDKDDFPYDPTKSSEESGNTSSISKRSTSYHFTDIPPIANANGPYSSIINEEIQFNSSGSYDSDGFILLYSWSFGDGEIGVGKAVTHHYVHPGLYQITLKVTDNLGVSNIDITKASIVIPNRPPSHPIILGPANGIINTKYSYSFESSDADNDQITYILDWGDGSHFETGILQNNQYIAKLHQWNSSGNYTITVTTSDENSTTSSQMIVTIQDTIVVYNFAIIILGVFVLIVLLITYLYSKKKKKNE